MYRPSIIIGCRGSICQRRNKDLKFSDNRFARPHLPMQKADVGRNFQWFLGPDSLRDGLHLLQLAANKTRISSHLVVVGSNPAARQPLRALRCIQNDFTCPTMEQASRQSHCLERFLDSHCWSTDPPAGPGFRLGVAPPWGACSNPGRRAPGCAAVCKTRFETQKRVQGCSDWRDCKVRVV